MTWRCAVCVGKFEWRAPNRILVVQLGTSAKEAKVFGAHAALLVPPKLLANQQTEGADSEYCNRLARKKQKRNHGRAEKLHRIRQPQCNGRGSLSRGRNPVKIT